MLGIKDPQVLLAYLLCLLSTILCITYGILHWNQGEEPVYPEDKKWVEDEKETTDTL